MDGGISINRVETMWSEYRTHGAVLSIAETVPLFLVRYVNEVPVSSPRVST